MALPMFILRRLCSGNISSTTSQPLKLRRVAGLLTPRRCKSKAQPAPLNVAKDDRPYVNVGTIGHIDHGKTTLTSAITRALSAEGAGKFIKYDEIDRAPEEKLRGITINATHLEYSTPSRHYAHTDCPGHADFIKNMICGTSQMDGAVLVVAGDDGCMPQTREHLLICKQLGVSKIIGFINKADLVDRDLLELIELEVRDLLEQYQFEGAMEMPIVCGSALLAMEGDESEYGLPSVRKLLSVMDSYFEPPKRDLTSPVLAPLEGGISIRGRGTVVVGTLFRGTLRRMDPVELLGFDKTLRTVVTEIQRFGKSIEECHAGDHVGLLVRGVKAHSVERGMTLVAPGSASMGNRFGAQLYLFSPSEGGRTKPVSRKYIMPMFCSTWTMPCRVDVVGEGMLMPGDYGDVELTLPKKMLLTPGQSFSIREEKRTVATGVISKVLPDVMVTTSQVGKVQLPG